MDLLLYYMELAVDEIGGLDSQLELSRVLEDWFCSLDRLGTMVQ